MNGDTARGIALRCSLAAAIAALHAAAQGVDDRPARRVADSELQGRINDAVEAGIAHLKRAQTEDGSWTYPLPAEARRNGREDGAADDYTGGLTALALYALAASSVPPQDPAIDRGLRWVAEHEHPYSTEGSVGTYSASLLILALTRIDVVKHRRWIAKLAARLAAAQLPDGTWAYVLGHPTASGGAARRPGDNSNTQFAVLGLWSAQVTAGCRVPRRTWLRVRALFERSQTEDGRWPYVDPQVAAERRRKGGLPLLRPTMTAAGLVSYVCASAALRGGIAGLPKAREEAVAQRGREAFYRDREKWSYHDYYLVYSIERVGTVLDVAAETWYPDGARRLLEQQLEDGRWSMHARRGERRRGPRPPPHGDERSAYETSLALLFLSRATVYPITPRPTDKDR